MKSLQFAVVMSLIAIASGCSDGNGDGEAALAPNSSQPSEYLTDHEPADGLPVGAARRTVEDGQAVTLVGTIGGSTEPFVEGLAAFTIVDPSVPHCAPDEGCPSPWDYCCTQDQVAENIATVMLVDSAGNPVNEDARELLGVEELATVTVRGTAERDAEGNLTIAANKVFVRSGE